MSSYFAPVTIATFPTSDGSSLTAHFSFPNISAGFACGRRTDTHGASHFEVVSHFAINLYVIFVGCLKDSQGSELEMRVVKSCVEVLIAE